MEEMSIGEQGNVRELLTYQQCGRSSRCQHSRATKRVV